MRDLEHCANVIKRYFLDFPLSPSDSSPNELREREKGQKFNLFRSHSLLGELSEGLRGRLLQNPKPLQLRLQLLGRGEMMGLHAHGFCGLYVFQAVINEQAFCRLQLVAF
jgi:hypothetical protein